MLSNLPVKKVKSNNSQGNGSKIKNNKNIQQQVFAGRHRPNY